MAHDFLGHRKRNGSGYNVTAGPITEIVSQKREPWYSDDTDVVQEARRRRSAFIHSITFLPSPTHGDSFDFLQPPDYAASKDPVRECKHGSLPSDGKFPAACRCWAASRAK